MGNDFPEEWQLNDRPPLWVKMPNGQWAINVKAFGAKGDGKTDDTQAIQRAIDFVAKMQRDNIPD